MPSFVRAFAIAGLLVFGSSTFRAVAEDLAHTWDDVAFDAAQLPADQARALEQQLEAEPDDRRARVQLIGYYWQRRLDDPAAAARHAEHVQSLIQADPTLELLRSPFAEVDPFPSPDAFTATRQLWEAQLDAHPDSAEVHANAASFLLLHDQAAAAGLLQRATTLDPASPDWPEMLAHAYHLEVAHLEGDARKAVAAKAVAALEQAIQRSAQPLARFYLLTDLAQMRLAAGDTDGAQQSARTLIEQAQRYRGDWNYGNAIHRGHSILGLIALEQDDLTAAKKHLRQSGETSGSPQLNSFGPEFDLADALLKAGERDAVIDHLEQVRTFWEMGGPTLDRWLAAIRAGATPDLDRFAGFAPPAE
jgi:tetratricopeptide (TPR) repeat protein